MKKLALLVMSARPWSFFLSLASVTTGSVIAYAAGTFHVGRFIVVAIGSVVNHAAINLLNDYFDFTHGVDDANAATSKYRPHPLVEGTMKPGQVLAAAVVCYALAIAAAIYMAVVVGWPIAAIVAVGVLISYFYTGEPLNFKRRGLGELSMFIATGPLMVAGAYFLQTGSWDNIGRVLLISIPVGMWWSLILSANNLRDIDTDRRTFGRTVAGMLGRRGAVLFFASLAAVIYGGTLLDILLGVMPVWAAAVFVTLPRVIALIRLFWTADRIPPTADPMTAQVEIVYSLLLVASFVLNRWVPFNLSL